MAGKRKWRNPSQADGTNTREYNLWLHMRNRCTRDSKSQASGPSYVGCELDPSWFNYDTFYDWFTSHPFRTFKCTNLRWYQLDKDLLVKGNKLYSQATCDLVPAEVNAFLTKREVCRGDFPLGVYLFKPSVYRAGVSNPFTNKWESLGLHSCPIEAFNVYKRRKEELAKLLADKYKDKITVSAHAALMNYTVEVTD